MKFVRCAECGTELMIFRKAMPKYNMIIDVVAKHVCPPTPVEFNPRPEQIPVVIPEPEGQFVQKLNELQPKTRPSDPIDHRPKENVKDTTSAPTDIQRMIESMKKGE